MISTDNQNNTTVKTQTEEFEFVFPSRCFKLWLVLILWKCSFIICLGVFAHLHFSFFCLKFVWKNSKLLEFPQKNSRKIKFEDLQTGWTSSLIIVTVYVYGHKTGWALTLVVRSRGSAGQDVLPAPRWFSWSDVVLGKLLRCRQPFNTSARRGFPRCPGNLILEIQTFSTKTIGC